MRLSHHIVLVFVAGALLTGCDDDDPRDVVDGCTREAAFRVNDEGVCAFGSSTASMMGASLELTGGDGERLTIQTMATALGTFEIPPGGGVFIDSDDVTYLSTTGTITFDDLGGTADGSFSFEAQATDGTIVSITEGVFEDL